MTKAIGEDRRMAHHTLYQVSTATALVEGIYQGLDGARNEIACIEDAPAEELERLHNEEKRRAKKRVCR